MPAAAGPRHPAFALAQLDAITAWSSGRLHGLRARIATHHPGFLEAAEISLRHSPAVRYAMNPTDRGTVFLARSSGGAWELGTVEAALDKVLALDAEAFAKQRPPDGVAHA